MVTLLVAGLRAQIFLPEIKSDEVNIISDKSSCLITKIVLILLRQVHVQFS